MNTDELLNSLKKPIQTYQMTDGMLASKPGSESAMARAVVARNALRQINDLLLRWAWERMDLFDPDHPDCAPEFCGGSTYDPCVTVMRTRGLRHDGQ